MKLTFLGMIPNEDKMSKAIIMQKPVTIVYPEAESSRSFVKIAEILLDIREEYEEQQRGLAYIFTRFFRSRKGE